MTISTTSQTLLDGPRRCIIHLTGVSDGSSQETDVVKVAVATLAPACRRVAVEKIEFDITPGLASSTLVKLGWGTINDGAMVPFANLSQAADLDLDDAFIQNREGTSGTGDILLSTYGFGLNSAYTITLYLIKKYTAS